MLASQLTETRRAQSVELTHERAEHARVGTDGAVDLRQRVLHLRVLPHALLVPLRAARGLLLELS